MYNRVGILCGNGFIAEEVNILTKRYTVDRIEGEFAVLVPDDGKGSLSLKLSDFDLKVSTTVDVTIEEGRVISCDKVEGESEKRLKTNTDRLHALFAKNKK